MSERSVRIFLTDMVKSADKILRITGGRTYSDFVSDEVSVDPVIRNLEVIGEAVKHIPAAFKRPHGNVQWKKIAGLRDILIHEYFAREVSARAHWGCQLTTQGEELSSLQVQPSR